MWTCVENAGECVMVVTVNLWTISWIRHGSSSTCCDICGCSFAHVWQLCVNVWWRVWICFTCFTSDDAVPQTCCECVKCVFVKLVNVWWMCVYLWRWFVNCMINCVVTLWMCSNMFANVRWMCVNVWLRFVNVWRHVVKVAGICRNVCECVVTCCECGMTCCKR